MSRNLTALILALAAGYFVWVTFFRVGFSEQHISDVKQSIRTEFEKRSGIKVTDVQMMKEDSRKLVGFVKLSAPILGEVTRSCTATMAEDGQNYVWRCE